MLSIFYNLFIFNLNFFYDSVKFGLDFIHKFHRFYNTKYLPFFTVSPTFTNGAESGEEAL